MIDPADNRRARFIPAILIVLTLAAMSPLLFADFTNWDDRDTVTENPWLNPPALHYFGKFWNPKPPVYMDIYIPLTYTVWSALAWESYLPTEDPVTHTHLNSWIFHSANLTFHIIGVLAVYVILMLLVKRPWPAALGAALYAVHPVQVEPVAWVSGLKDVLAGCMGLLAIWQYLVYAIAQQDSQTFAISNDYKARNSGSQVVSKRETSGQIQLEYRNEQSSGGHPFQPFGVYAFATIALLMALLSKPSAVVVPLVAGVLDLVFLRRPLRSIVISLAPWVVLVLPFVIEGRIAQQSIYVTYVTPLVYRPLIAADTLAYYLYKLFSPLRLTIIYNRTPEAVLEHHWAYFTWIAPALVVIALWIWRKRFPWLLGAVGVYWAAVLPVLGLAPFDFQDFSTVADHYLYLAMLGPAIGLAFLLRHAGQRAMWIAAAIIGLLAIRTWFQSRVWDSSETLYRHAIALNPYACAPYNNLSYIYRDEHLYAQEIQILQEGISRVPHCVQLQIHLGMVLGNEGQLDTAEHLFSSALTHTRVPGLKKLAQQGLDEVVAARRRPKSAPATRKGAPASEPHLTPVSQPIK